MHGVKESASVWSPSDLASMNARSIPRLPEMSISRLPGLLSDLIYWDMWPVQDENGCIVSFDGQEFWMILAAERAGNPHERHLKSHIRWLRFDRGDWVDLGRVLPEFGGPYEREWSGSAKLVDGLLTLFFTGAGLTENPGGYEQNLFVTEAELEISLDRLKWSAPIALIDHLPPAYLPATDHHGEPGKIRALRDPAYFRDPADGQEYIAFTASLAGARSDHNGMFGLAVRDGPGWSVLDPIIHAEGVNNELERAHIVHRNGRYYAFWATQTHTFAEGLQGAPTGLYGMVAESVRGPYVPLNETGLVVANPEKRPCNFYSWFVSSELKVCSFLDYPDWKGGSPPGDPVIAEAEFAGLPAPIFRLKVDGDVCRVDKGSF